jgi:hypothetical protein
MNLVKFIAAHGGKLGALRGYHRSSRQDSSHAARCVARHGVRYQPVPVALVGECSMALLGGTQVQTG